jgi:outer membrane immunogenic protein
MAAILGAFMQKFATAVAALAMLVSTSALAADMAVKAPPSAPVAPIYNWTGFYVGANAGYGWGGPGVSFDTPTFLPAGATPASLASDPHGFLGGFQAGYNYQWDRMVLGLETDLDYASIRSSQTVSLVPINIYTTSAEQKLNWLGTARARLGFLPSDRLLMYATGGLAYGRGTASSSNSVTLGGPPACAFFLGCGTGSTSGWLVGWTAGAGLEWAFTDRWAAKGEYLYYDIGSLSYSYVDSPAPAPTGLGFHASGSFRGSIVRVGLDYKLN